jgi:hypothetical protein
LKSILNKIRHIKASLDLYKNLEDLDIPSLDIDPSEISDLSDKRDNIKTLVSEANKIKKQISEAEEEQKVAEDELAAFDACPLCGK